MKKDKAITLTGRRTGKRSAMMMQTIMRLISGESVAFPGCKDPEAIIKGLGIDCNAELMTTRNDNGEVIETGYLLTYKAQ